MLSILLFETIVAFIYGKACLQKKSKAWMIVTVTLLFLPLLCFKYLNFLTGTIGDVLSLANFTVAMPKFELLLPIGISFYTFMAVGYVVDVYIGKVQTENNLLDFALFVGFFPQIASGPIGRAGQLIPQLKEKKPLLYENITIGAKMMLWGFFMKLVVGDRAGIYVDTVFGNYAHHNGTSLLLATFMYTIQIYCDFAGYSLIAIGAAKTMGYELMENFRRPYFATSVADFWRKWHISLSTWFRDYVYFPCGGSRCSSLRTNQNLMITFLASGLWHGAAYNFILWGFYHGLNQVIGKVLMPFKDKCRKLLSISEASFVRKVWDITLTFCLVAYGWMLFYAPDMQFIKNVTKGYFQLGTPYIHQTTIFFFAIGFAILLLKDLKDEFFADRVLSFEDKHPKISTVWHYMRFALLAIFIVWIGVLDGGQFIYFKF
jgi:D-alanyl-lipoteichoic acid acyltransferase DltB (MBOAT superfamily)